MNKLYRSFRTRRMPKFYFAAMVIFFATYGFTLYQSSKLPPGDKNNAGLVLPDGFEALAVVDSLPGFARHLAVNANGDIYVKTRLHALNNGYGNIAMRDTDNDGKADIITPFNKYESSQYGTAMKIHNGYLYYSSNLIVFRQKLTPGTLVPEGKIDTIVWDMPPSHAHQTKPIAFDGKGYMYVGWGLGSDVCTNGRPGAMGAGKADPEIPGEGCPGMIY